MTYLNKLIRDTESESTRDATEWMSMIDPKDMLKVTVVWQKQQQEPQQHNKKKETIH